MSADPITVLVLMAASGHDVTPQISDTLAASVNHRIETLMTARRGPLPADEIERIEFTVATELLVLALAMVARLPSQFDLRAVRSAMDRALVDLQGLRDERGGT